MTDPLSVAFGVAQVAQTGFQLVGTIYNYTNSVRKAEQQLQPIAEYVHVTSTAFEHIASHLRDDELRTLYKPELLTSTEDALKGCEAAFGRLKTYIQTLISEGEDKPRGLITTKTKFTWRWKQKELESHQVHLERCKSTVSVLLGTLTLVSVAKNLKNSTSNNKDLLGTKLELQRLLKMEAEAKQKEARLVALASSTLPEDVFAQQFDHSEKSRDISEMTALALQRTWTGSTPQSNSVARPHKTQQRHVESYQSLSSQLYACESAMDKLSATLRETIRNWDRFQKYDPSSLVPDFQTLNTAIKSLPTYKKDFSSISSIGQAKDISTEASYYDEYDWDYRDHGDLDRVKASVLVTAVTPPLDYAQSYGHKPVPVVDVYNDVFRDTYQQAEPPYRQYQRYQCSISTGRKDNELADDVADLREESLVEPLCARSQAHVAGEELTEPETASMRSTRLSDYPQAIQSQAATELTDVDKLLKKWTFLDV